MRKLTPEEIGFIDKYLENSEVKFYDIRLELVDHIAKAVEEKMQTENLTFYEAFKSYMIKNKKDLLKETERIKKEAFYKVLKMFVINLFHPVTIVVTVLSWLFIRQFFGFISQATLAFSIILLVALAIPSVIIAWPYVGNKYKHKKLLYSSQLGALSMILYNGFQLLFMARLHDFYMIAVLIFVTLNVSYTISLKKVYDDHQKKLLLS